VSSKNGNPKNSAGIVPECPYCLRPELLKDPAEERPQSNGLKESVVMVRKVGRLWRRPAPHAPSRRRFELEVKTRNLGDHWRGVIQVREFTRRFKDFSFAVIGVDVLFRVTPPPPFASATMYILPDAGRKALNPDYPDAVLTLYSALVAEHKSGKVRLEAHWWPTHDWLLNLRAVLPPEGRNDALDVAQVALEFFRQEMRGAEKKITDERLKRVLSKLGDTATQVAAAKALKVSETALEKWRRRQGIESWRDVVNHYSSP